VPRVVAIVFTVTLGAGSLALLVWIFVADVTDAMWTRVMTLFNVFASLGYAGVGYLLGHQVQQVNLGEAQKKTAEAQQKMSEMKREASLALQTEFVGKGVTGATVMPAGVEQRPKKHSRKIRFQSGRERASLQVRFGNNGYVGGSRDTLQPPLNQSLSFFDEQHKVSLHPHQSLRRRGIALHWLGNGS
jgi:hypothetical protein